MGDQTTVKQVCVEAEAAGHNVCTAYPARLPAALKNATFVVFMPDLDLATLHADAHRPWFSRTDEGLARAPALEFTEERLVQIDNTTNAVCEIDVNSDAYAMENVWEVKQAENQKLIGRAMMRRQVFTMTEVNANDPVSFVIVSYRLDDKLVRPSQTVVLDTTARHENGVEDYDMLLGDDDSAVVRLQAEDMVRRSTRLSGKEPRDFRKLVNPVKHEPELDDDDIEIEEVRTTIPTAKRVVVRRGKAAKMLATAADDNEQHQQSPPSSPPTKQPSSARSSAFSTVPHPHAPIAKSRKQVLELLENIGSRRTNMTKVAQQLNVPKEVISKWTKSGLEWSDVFDETNPLVKMWTPTRVTAEEALHIALFDMPSGVDVCLDHPKECPKLAHCATFVLDLGMDGISVEEVQKDAHAPYARLVSSEVTYFKVDEQEILVVKHLCGSDDDVELDNTSDDYNYKVKKVVHESRTKQEGLVRRTIYTVVAADMSSPCAAIVTFEREKLTKQELQELAQMDIPAMNPFKKAGEKDLYSDFTRRTIETCKKVLTGNLTSRTAFSKIRQLVDSLEKPEDAEAAKPKVKVQLKRASKQPPRATSDAKRTATVVGTGMEPEEELDDEQSTDASAYMRMQTDSPLPNLPKPTYRTHRGKKQFLESREIIEEPYDPPRSGEPERYAEWIEAPWVPYKYGQMLIYSRTHPGCIYRFYWSGSRDRPKASWACSACQLKEYEGEDGEIVKAKNIVAAAKKGKDEQEPQKRKKRIIIKGRKRFTYPVGKLCPRSIWLDIDEGHTCDGPLPMAKMIAELARRQFIFELRQDDCPGVWECHKKVMREYYLLGLSHGINRNEILEELPWSVSSLVKATLRRHKIRRDGTKRTLPPGSRYPEMKGDNVDTRLGTIHKMREYFQRKADDPFTLDDDEIDLQVRNDAEIRAEAMRETRFMSESMNIIPGRYGARLWRALTQESHQYTPDKVRQVDESTMQFTNGDGSTSTAVRTGVGQFKCDCTQFNDEMIYVCRHVRAFANLVDEAKAQRHWLYDTFRQDVAAFNRMLALQNPEGVNRHRRSLPGQFVGRGSRLGAVKKMSNAIRFALSQLPDDIEIFAEEWNIILAKSKSFVDQNLVQTFPHDPDLFLVLVDRQPFTVQRHSKILYECNCDQFVALRCVCMHTLAVARSLNEHIEYISMCERFVIDATGMVEGEEVYDEAFVVDDDSQVNTVDVSSVVPEPFTPTNGNTTPGKLRPVPQRQSTTRTGEQDDYVWY